jgi:uncharacterized SAM-binding protein YcdF (DUF218 family)
MFFFFSKVLEFFIYPFSWILILTIAALLVKKQPVKRKLVLASLAVMLIFSDTFLINQVAKLWDIKPVPLKTNGPYSCAIVLGGFATEASNGNAFFNSASDRFIQGLKLLNTGKVSRILISGGNGSLIADKFEESDWVKAQLKLFKVPDSCILVENRSRNTLENAAFTKPILLSNHLAPPYVLVTSAFHMRRSLAIFKAQKLDVVPYPCNYLAGQNDVILGDFVPDAGAFGTWNVYIKEMLGTLVNYIK